jgi:hypothetical protein
MYRSVYSDDQTPRQLNTQSHWGSSANTRYHEDTPQPKRKRSVQDEDTSAKALAPPKKGTKVATVLNHLMRGKLLLDNAFPPVDEIRRMQQDCVSEAGMEWGDGSDMMMRMSKATDLRCALYLKVRGYLENHILIDPATRKEIVWQDGTPEQKAEVKLYLKGSWFYQSCTRNSQGQITVPFISFSFSNILTT